MNPREWQLDTHQLGRRVVVYDATDSTSSRCAEFAGDPANHGLAVLAHTQTAGRGQYGRHWQCESGAGVLLSVLLFPPPALNRPAILTAWAAVSVCELVRDVAGLETRIKWPNDILIEGRKVCGILIEQNRGTVAGMGLNLNQTAEDFRAADLPEAASLRVFDGRVRAAEEIARRLLVCLDREFQRLCDGDIAGLEGRWRERLGLVGKPVEIEGHGQQWAGRLKALSFAALEFETPAGEKINLAPEQVKHIKVRQKG